MSAELLTFGPDVGAGARAGSHIAEFRAVLASSRSRWRKGERKSKVARDKFRQREREREHANLPCVVLRLEVGIWWWRYLLGFCVMYGGACVVVYVEEGC